MANKIIQMWEESSHTTALYPTSVAEAIKWDSSTTVAQKIASVEDKTGLAGVDTSTVLASGTANTYTATVDCYVYGEITVTTDAPRFKINGVGASYYAKGALLPLKKGDVLTFHYGGGQGLTNGNYIVYGIKK